MKIHTAIVGMLCLVALTTGACVMPSTYNETVADLDATKAELDVVRTQSQLLIGQVNELQQLKSSLAGQLADVSSALELAKQKMAAERMASQARLRTLTRVISQLTAQQNRLLYALQVAHEERPALLSMVEEYKAKLGEAEGPRAHLSPPPIVSTNEQAGTALAPPSQVAAQTDPASQPAVTAPAASANPATVNPNPQPVNKPTSEPAQDDWLTMIKEWVLSIWQSIFP